MDTKAVSQLILSQLGGNRFIAMTGARNLYHALDGGEPCLCFSLPSRFANNGINHVTIILNSTDTYTMIFRKNRGFNSTIIRRVPDLYCEDLQRQFTEATGLDTHL